MIALGHRATSAAIGAQHDLPFDEFETFLREYRGPHEKDGHWASLSKYRVPHRKVEQVEHISAFGGDLDTGNLSPEQLAAKLLGLRFVAHTSYSSTATHRKWRFFVPYARPATPAEHAAVFREMQRRLGGLLDESAKDVARLWFLPRHPEGGATEWLRGEGEALDPGSVPLAPETPAPALCGAQAPTNMRIEELRARLAHIKGDTHATRFAVCCAIKHDLGEDGFEAFREWKEAQPGTSTARAMWDGVRERSAGSARATLGTSVHLSAQGGYRKLAVRLVAPASVENIIEAAEYEALPPALKPCTDQANFDRLRAHTEGRVICANHVFYAWSGSCWRADDDVTHRAAMHLSRIVTEEAAEAHRLARKAWTLSGMELPAAALNRPERAALLARPGGERLLALLEAASELAKWAVRCEEEARQAAAVRLMRKNTSRSATSLFDIAEHLLACANGTIDLRTGELRAADPKDLITKQAGVAYDPTAQAPRFRQFLLDIMSGDQARVDFLQRWFGYSATGSTREQRMVLLIGRGANGKSSLINLVRKALGDIALAAPVNLLTSRLNNEELANARLRGSRFVEVAESDEGEGLCEARLKRLTGSDAVSAREHYRQSMNYEPAFKISMCSNARPVIRGTDLGIWRRLYLVNFAEQFGSTADLAAGRVTKLANQELESVLEAELPGILAWIVQGAVAWYRDGLTPPGSVIEASENYRTEQDRVAQFLAETFLIDTGTENNFTAFGGEGGVYTAYRAYCESQGIKGVFAQKRFTEELQRLVPGFRRDLQRPYTGAPPARGCWGLKILKPAINLRVGG